ncbi:MAG: amidase [Pseudomonadota bacterium]
MQPFSTSARDLSRALESGEVSATEVMESTLDRIEAVNAKVNAIVSLRDRETLLQEARAADNEPRRGWLHGIPMAIKDLVNAAGLPTSFGSPLYAGTLATEDDLYVSRLRAAGAIFIGKTNTPEFGNGSHTVNPVFGATRNPYDVTKSAGGSSGGAAVALATGMLAVADGSDMMGSLRNPAGWNNVYGMRPTWGLVPATPRGEAFFSQLSTDGPMARSPADLAALLDTMAGPDPRVPTSGRQPATLDAIDSLASVPRIAWLGDWSGAYAMETGVLDCCEAALSQMQNLGWFVDATAAPFPSEALWTSWTHLRAYLKAMTARVDGAEPQRRAQLGANLIWEIEFGETLSPLQIWEASELRSDWFRCAAHLFENTDILALPSAQMWPFDVTWQYPHEIAGKKMDCYHRWMEVVIPASLIGLPVVNVPCGFGENGLPMGLQLIGAPGSDGYLLQVAQRWHSATEWPQRRPALV